MPNPTPTEPENLVACRTCKHCELPSLIRIIAYMHQHKIPGKPDPRMLLPENSICTAIKKGFNAYNGEFFEITQAFPIQQVNPVGKCQLYEPKTKEK